MDGSRIVQRIFPQASRVVMLVGAYGSGKTEVAVHLALALAGAGRPVQLADLDLVNPYFRSREAKAEMEARGVRVVVPPGDQAMADLPIVLPEVQGLLNPPPGTISILDMGGDDVGARVLSSFRPLLGRGRYELWQVVNARRPFTSTVEGCLTMRYAIESATRLRITGLVGNTHLLEETTPEIVRAGWRLVSSLSRATALPVRCVAVTRPAAQALRHDEIDAPLLPIDRKMLPPWLRRASLGAPAPVGEAPEAAFLRPIGLAPSLSRIRSPGVPPRPHRH
jgi:hypothetical protein